MIKSCFDKALINADIKDLTTIKIGGKAKYLFTPESVKELRDIIEECTMRETEYVILGNGSNVLFCSDYYSGAVICTKKLCDVIIEDCTVKAMCGANINGVIHKCAEHGLGGLEVLSGIPATVGGLIYMNGGAFGHTVGEKLIKAEVIKDGKLKVYNQSELNFSYRKSELMNCVLISATFALERFAKSDCLDKIKQINELRNKKFPKGFSLGCVFKNPQGKNAGELIEKCALKGYNIGDAIISEKHADFFINLGNATYGDYLSLINLAKQRVYDTFGIRLYEEIKFVGLSNDTYRRLSHPHRLQPR